MKLPKDLREKMSKYNVNWDQLIREFVSKKIEELDRESHAKKAKEILESVDIHTNGFAIKEVRRNRESN